MRQQRALVVECDGQRLLMRLEGDQVVHAALPRVFRALWRAYISNASKDAVRDLPPVDPLQRYSIEEAIAYLRSSRRSIYLDIRKGRLRVLKEGKRTYIPGSEIVRRSQLIQL